jgi:hypothetical protein
MSEITDPKSRTILLMESHGRTTPGAKPSDLSFKEAVALLSEPSSHSASHEYQPPQSSFAPLLVKRGHGIHVVMADGTVQFLALPLPKDLAAAILTVDGSEGQVHDQLEYYFRPRLDLGKCYALAMFTILSLLPAAPLFWRPGAARQAMPPLE